MLGGARFYDTIYAARKGANADTKGSSLMRREKGKQKQDRSHVTFKAKIELPGGELCIRGGE